MITNSSLDRNQMANWKQIAHDFLTRWNQMVEDEGIDNPADPYWHSIIARTFRSNFNQGLHRTVFVQKDCAIKIDHGDGANLLEWRRWHKLSDAERVHVVTPYCITDCGTVLVVEKLRVWQSDYELQEIEKQVALTLEECPTLAKISDSRNYENWAFRKSQAVLLDLAGFL